MQKTRRIRQQPRFARVDALLCPLFDWFTALPREEAASFRSEIMATVMLRPVPLILSSLGILLMSATAMVVTHARWAAVWFGIDLVVLLVRLVPTIRHERRGGALPDPVARLIVCLAFCLLLMFSLGCSAAVLTEQKPLAIVATASMMGLVAGLATRWAALPRLALTAVVLFVTPFCCAVATAAQGGLRAGAIQVAMIVVSVAALSVQNRTTLIALLRAERRNGVLATTDTLTGLPNRAGLIAALARIRALSLPDSEIATLFIDLDAFKAINDRHGHSAGDRVLVAVAQRLQAAVRPHFVCRLGGDEFVVLATGIDRTNATFLARRIVEQLEQPFEDCSDRPVLAGASVGIAFGPVADRGADQILADADVALYLAKEAGGGRHAIGSAIRATG
ncbi:GGDEF domain-containing protein [uncultured Sphingomonas sp.]|uniref:GGDEF domain-containing protein n=1 Tax=uncultured Sphingomonas sp. TaxID=158754 RepID=UPI00261C869F|nr:GGDEF domain-containing protein [uncultured Sphingomonas sp.]